MSGEGKRAPLQVHVATVPFSLHCVRGQPAYMKAHGFDVAAVSSPEPLLDDFGREQGVSVHGVSIPRRIAPHEDVLSVVRLTRLWRRLRPSVVHAHTPKGGLLGMLSARLARVPVAIYTIHGFPYLTATGRRRSLLQWSERIACRLADHVLVVSNSVRELAVQDGICAPDKIEMLLGGSANGIDAEGMFNPGRFSEGERSVIRRDLGLPDDAIVLVFVGRLAGDKGVNELVAAWSGLREEYPRLHLVIAGGPDARDPANPDVLASLERDDQVHMLGDVELRRVAELYAVSHVKVLPTYREGFPTVLLEASAMGLPIVATDVSGCVDAVVDGETGRLVPARDASALATAIRRYLDDPELRRRHGAAGRARMLAEFRLADVWEAIRMTYVRLLIEKGQPEPSER